MVFTVESRRLGARLAWRIRWVAVRGIASAFAGVLVLGVGGRLVMLASRFLHPDAIGRTTDNGNRIGEFTVEGTVARILFGGLLSGLVAGVIWALVKEWIPPNPALVGFGVIAIGGFQLIEADNPDFVILEGPGPDLALLVGLPARLRRSPPPFGSLARSSTARGDWCHIDWFVLGARRGSCPDGDSNLRSLSHT